MKTEVLVKRLRMTADHYYSRECGPTYDLLNESADRLQELTPKHDPEIADLVARLRATRSKMSGTDWDWNEMADIAIAAYRLEELNPPPPAKPITKLSAEVRRLARDAQDDTPENRAKLEAAIKILAG